MRPYITCAFTLCPKPLFINSIKLEGGFFWQGGGTKRKYHLLKWTKICKHKKKWGLGIKDIRKMNVSLLCKWWWKLEKENGLWQKMKIIHFKYMNGKSVCIMNHRQSDSAMWYDLLKIRHIYLQGRKMKVRNGRNTLFWKDSWIYDKPPSAPGPV